MHTSNHKMLRAAVAGVLRPLVRLMLHQGLLLREFAEICKHVFFIEGKEILSREGGRLTASQLSVLTGLHRKDIALFLDDVPAETLPVVHSAGAAVIGIWLTDPHFMAGRKPLPLPYAEQPDGSPSFTELVELVSKDIRPRAHLDELLRMGVVSVDAEERVLLRQAAFIPNEDFGAKLKFFERNIGDHLSASASNILADKPTFFDRSAFHGQLTEADVQKLRALVDEQGMQLLKDVYHLAEKLAAANQKRKSGTPLRRFTLGLYLYDDKDKHDA